MGNGNYNHQNIHDRKSTFLPMFCRLSIKDVKINTVPITTGEPSSPKVSCMGQVKRNNRVAGFPAATNHHKYTKPIKELFSTQTLLSNPTTINAAKTAGGGGSRSCRTNMAMGVKNFRRSRVKNCNQDCDKVAMDISEMDPPLPVLKRVAPPGVGRGEMNIWKRRANGVKRLQIEPIHLPNNRFQLPPTTLL